jgi:predicted alpha/beta superfamily hydrolase
LASRFAGSFLLVFPAFLPAGGLHTVSAQSTDTLYFWLDVRGPIEAGWFDPASETVGLRGDGPPLSWGTTLPASDPDGDGLFELTLPVQAADDSQSIGLKIKIDGVDNPNDGWQGGANHLVAVRTGQSQVVSLVWEDEAPPRSTISGHVEILEGVRFEDLAARDVYVYLPPGYDQSGRSYPVLYMQDGQNLFDAAAMGQEWQVDETAEELIPSGSIEPIIVVGIGNTGDRIDEYTPTEQHWRQELERVSRPTGEGNPDRLSGTFANLNGDTLRVNAAGDTLLARLPGYDFWQEATIESDSTLFIPRAEITLLFDPTDPLPVKRVVATKPPRGGRGAVYGRFVVEHLKPLIDRRFRTLPGAGSTGLGGSSLGGLITLYMGLQYPDVFGKLLMVSPSVWWDDRWILTEVHNYTGPKHQRIWLDIGLDEDEDAVSDVRTLYDALITAGWPTDRLRFMEVPGGLHNERSWGKRVPEMLKYLFPQ